MNLKKNVSQGLISKYITRRFYYINFTSNFFQTGLTDIKMY